MAGGGRRGKERVQARLKWDWTRSRMAIAAGATLVYHAIVFFLALALQRSGRWSLATVPQPHIAGGG